MSSSLSPSWLVPDDQGIVEAREVTIYYSLVDNLIGKVRDEGLSGSVAGVIIIEEEVDLLVGLVLD
jgi:hypothetical protein